MRMLGYNHDLVFSLFLNEVFSREPSQPPPKRLKHETALMNSRCAGHPKHTLAPWHSSRETPWPQSCSPQEQLQARSISHHWEPEPQTQNEAFISPWVPGNGGNTFKGPGFASFGTKDGRDTDQTTQGYLLLIPQRGTLSLASLATLWATCSSQDSLLVLCTVLGWAARDRSFFLPSLLRATKAQINPI